MDITKPKLKFVIGIVAGLVTSFAFYSFLYICRETLRLISLTEHYDLTILTDKEVNFYNLFIESAYGFIICNIRSIHLFYNLV